jgi:hypothetical protein
MSNGFSEVAATANINDLAGGGWQKPPVVFYSVPPEKVARIRSENPDHLRGWGFGAALFFRVYFWVCRR